MKDLAGQRFGRLTAIEPTAKRSRGLVVWRCLCDCGREVEVVGSSLAKGNTRSCGCMHADGVRSDIAGKRFGKLVAIEPTGRRSRRSIVWKCRCDCGNTCEASTAALNSGHKRSCGCLRGGPGGHSATKDLAGRRFGKLVAVRPAGRKNGYVLWECACDCGNSKLVTTSMLTSGKVRSCGCLRRSPQGGSSDPADLAARERGLAGRRFGKLVVVDRAGGCDAGQEAWRCLCDCDRVVRATSDQLTSGEATACGQCG